MLCTLNPSTSQGWVKWDSVRAYRTFWWDSSINTIILFNASKTVLYQYLKISLLCNFQSTAIHVRILSTLSMSKCIMTYNFTANSFQMDVSEYIGVGFWPTWTLRTTNMKKWWRRYLCLACSLQVKCMKCCFFWLDPLTTHISPAH
jgi:hypothetical protein